MKAVRSVIPYLRGKWNLVLAYMLAHLLSVAFTTLTVGMIPPFLDILFDKAQPITANPGLVFSKEGVGNYFNYLLSHFIATHNNDKVWGLVFVCGILITSTLLKNIFLYIAKYILNPLRNSVLRALRRDMFTKLVELPIGFFTNERKGDILSRMTNDVHAVELSIIGTMELLFSTPITVIFYFTVLLVISPKLFFFLLVLLPVAGLLIGRVTKSLKRNTQNSQEGQASLLSIVEETLSGLRIVKGFGAEEQRKQAFHAENEQLYKINNAIASRRELASPMSEFLGICILSVIIWFGGNMALKQPAELAPGTFIMFISLFYFLINPLKALSGIFHNLYQGKTSIDRIQKIIQASNHIVDSPHATELNGFERDIEFRNVSFAYEGVEVLRNINLRIKKGQTIAIVGASGAGKSTLVDLIPRFHDVSSGEVLIDGKNIKDYTLHSVRKQMGIVSQEPILFNDTLLHNIALGANDIDAEQVRHAAKVANALDFVMAKEEGLNTLAGDRGSKLSGGEKQRITIARAIYKNPPILILDEATSSLDTVSERQVQQAIDALMQQRTSIVIAHRLSTVQHADNIVVLDKGRIIEQGTHDMLLSLGGQYSKLVSMQSLV